MIRRVQPERRRFLKQAGLAMLAAGRPHAEGDAQSPDVVPNSAGTERPRLKAPPNACDCHMHIYDPARFQMVPNPRVPPPNSAVPQYRLLQKRIGTTRVVIVTPRNYATQNDVTLDAIAQLGPDARGVAVVQPSVTDAELRRLNQGGVRGIRFSLTDPAGAITTIDMVEPLATRVADLGWHIQLNVEGPQILAWENILRRVPCQMVFDHMAKPPLPDGVAHPSHRVVMDLINQGKAWVKISAAYSNSLVGPPYPDATRIARAFVNAAPERLVWGSDWPHPTATVTPDDAVLFDLLAEWAPNERTRHRILVENPESVYGFPKA